MLPFQQMAYLERDLQRQPQFGVFQGVAQQFFDTAQAVEKRIAVQVHGAGRLSEISVVAKDAFERPYRIDAASGVGIEQGAKCLLVKIRQSVVPVQVKEQPVYAQLRERVQFPAAKEPPPDFQRLLRLLVGLRDAGESPGKISNAAGIGRRSTRSPESPARAVALLRARQRSFQARQDGLFIYVFGLFVVPRPGYRQESGQAARFLGYPGGRPPAQ